MSQSHSDKPSITLPVIALVSIFVCWPVGLVLSIIAFVKFIGAHGTEARTLSIVAFILNFVVVIPMIGILAAIAIPNFVKFQCRSKQSEAKGNLKALYVGEEAYRAEFNAYSNDPAKIGFTPRGQKIRYTYTIVDAGAGTFRAEARGIGDMAGDLWVIDNNNALQNVTNSCDGGRPGL